MGEEKKETAPEQVSDAITAEEATKLRVLILEDIAKYEQMIAQLRVKISEYEYYIAECRTAIADVVRREEGATYPAEPKKPEAPAGGEALPAGIKPPEAPKK